MATQSTKTPPATTERVFLTYREAAELIEATPTEIAQAVADLDIAPATQAGPEKRLQIIDTLVITAQARRASVEEVAGGILARTKGAQKRKTTQAEIDYYFAALHEPAEAMPEEEFLAELEKASPKKPTKQPKLEDPFLAELEKALPEEPSAVDAALAAKISEQAQRIRHAAALAAA